MSNISKAPRNRTLTTAPDEIAVLSQRLLHARDVQQGDRSLQSTRAVGDAVQEFLSENGGLKTCLPESAIQSFESEFTRRSMEDMAFEDTQGIYYAVDVKTHNLSTAFSMPNLISVRKLANFYQKRQQLFLHTARCL